MYSSKFSRSLQVTTKYLPKEKPSLMQIEMTALLSFLGEPSVNIPDINLTDILMEVERLNAIPDPICRHHAIADYGRLISMCPSQIKHLTALYNASGEIKNIYGVI